MRTSFRQLNRFRKADEGQALVFVAMGLMTLLMVAGLGVDVGYLHYQKEQMQKAADSAALAGAAALAYASDYHAAGINDATANGFANGSNGITVAVHNPPTTANDPFLNNPDAVEAIVTQARPTFFMKVLGVGSVTVSARAVASKTGPSPGCIFALDPTDARSFLVDGNVTVYSSCGIYVNSSDRSQALRENGNSGSVTVAGHGLGIGVVGGYSGNNFTPTPVTGIPPVRDPLANYAPPTYNSGTCNYQGNKVGTTGFTSLSAPSGTAVICGPISLTGHEAVTFGSGTYILLGGLSVGGGASVTGSDVTFYVTKNASYSYSGVNLTGNSVSTLSAPTTGPLAGILFFQDRSVPTSGASSSFDGTSGSKFTGAIYFPTTNIQYKGTPNQADQSVIIGWQLEFKGNANLDNSSLTNIGSPAQSAILVE